jgi:hypothetical protein
MKLMETFYFENSMIKKPGASGIPRFNYVRWFKSPDHAAGLMAQKAVLESTILLLLVLPLQNFWLT